MNRDVEVLVRKLDSLARSAARLRANACDLHDLGWEAATTGEEKVAGGGADYSPRAGDPRARSLFERISAGVASVEAELVGYDRAVHALFFARSANPEPSRGSLISADEHGRLLAKQRQRPDTPARIVDQPVHPGRSTS